MTTTLAALKERYSVLLTLDQLAKILDRSPEGLRISLSTSRADWARHINATKKSDTTATRQPADINQHFRYYECCFSESIKVIGCIGDDRKP